MSRRKLLLIALAVCWELGLLVLAVLFFWPWYREHLL